ncbi:YqgE/AlgH family protein [Psychromonas hadalis]|uniref:YqgE/AlgH family protein n=1 Tax=Psychromonas hadalis TaxID=211669 RepID=UPI0003B60381|nr:YqgE/AlgH family protein [Psychromonas hadalis]
MNDKINKSANPELQQNEVDVNSDKTEVLSTLKDHFLIAMPALTDPYFKQSVVYLCEHDEEGAMGFIINFPVKLTLQELLSNVESIKHQPEPPLEDAVFLGGPLELERGFVLHSPLADNSQSTELNEHLMMSNSNAVLSTLGTDDAPEKYIVALGYASWSSGQLEQEMNDNHWLTIESENDIIFNTPAEKRWSASLQRLGISPEQLTTTTGHA